MAMGLICSGYEGIGLDSAGQYCSYILAIRDHYTLGLLHFYGRCPAGVLTAKASLVVPLITSGKILISHPPISFKTPDRHA
jgi:hypothetical protein